MSTITAMSSGGSSARQPSEGEVDRICDILVGKRTAVVTGAGLSTDSGIPDYRGEGAPPRTPMTVQQFLSSENSRKRYWAGSHLGWRAFSAARPNVGHTTLAELEQRGLVAGVVTQNVDGLHLRAGSRRVVDLHGSMDRVSCLQCGQTFARESVADRILAANPWIELPDSIIMAPDGDAEVTRVDEFVVPSCSVCGGILKPDVVFFGEFIPTEKFAEAKALVHASDVLLIAGSSLVVNSGIRLLEQARRRRMPIVIVNRGLTRGDRRATVKVDAGTSETLLAVSERLGRLSLSAAAV